MFSQISRKPIWPSAVSLFLFDTDSFVQTFKKKFINYSVCLSVSILFFVLLFKNIFKKLDCNDCCCFQALNITTHVLKKGGTFVAKVDY